MSFLSRLGRFIGIIGLTTAIACGSAQEVTPTPSGPQPTSPGETVPAAQPTAAPQVPEQPSGDKYGGILRVQVHLDPTGVDLHTPRGASQREFWISIPALNYLVAEEPGGTPGPIIPDLAQSWDVTLNANGTADWTFTLNPNARWHNGEPVTVEDIKFNFDRVKSPPEGLTIGRARPVGTYYENVNDVKIDGNNITVHTGTHSQGFLAAVALTNFPMYNKAATEALPQPLIRDYSELVGSGPFIPEDYETGARYSLSRNPDYWEDSSLPYLDGIEVLVMVDEATRLAALQTQQVDIAYPQLDASLFLQLQEMDHMVTEAVLGDVGHWDVQMNELRVPWNDFRVRRAVSLGMDRNLVGEISERGFGSPYGILYPPGSPYALPVEEVMQMPGFAEDKEAEFEEARRLLAEYSEETGYDFTQPIAMLTENRAENIEGATLLIQQLSNIGITGGFMDVQEDAVTEEREIAHDFNIMIRRFGGPVDPDLQLQNQYVTDGARNFAAMSHPRIDELYEAQRNAQSEQERARIIQDMARRFWEVQAGSVPMWWRPQFQAYNKRVQDYHPTLAFSPNATVTRVWLSEK